jgi:hypothetical protein
MGEEVEILAWICHIFHCNFYVYVYKEDIKALFRIPCLLGVHESLPFTYTAGILNTLFCFD